MKAKKEMTKKTGGLHFERYFVPEDKTAAETVDWETRDAKIEGKEGVVFEQKGVEFPKEWSETAAAVVASKYFRGQMTSPERERTLEQMVGRVAGTIKRWGLEGDYFATKADAERWTEDLSYLIFHQYASFNSPVWFNIGAKGRSPQASACFINSIEDDMGSIMDLAKTEAIIFKGGSGAGVNLSKLRGSKEQLSGGGYASGPVSFMRGYDSFAGVIKSGGTTRRAAKMVILNADHPDIEEFIRCKQVEEHKAWALIEAGYEAGFNIAGGAYDSVMFQNANHSVRVTDEFMRAVEEDGAWQTHAVADGQVMENLSAGKLWDEIADSAWDCGDPGLQFDDEIQAWNCVPNTARINATNPCSEFIFVDDSACNLLSLNLMKFWNPKNGFNVEAYKRAIDICLTGMEIMVGEAEYPTVKITENSRKLRPLGIGYCNLGALLMANGLAYDSEAGRGVAAAVTAMLTGRAYAQSARMAAAKGAFEDYAKNAQAMLHVMDKHLKAAYDGLDEHRMTTYGFEPTTGFGILAAEAQGAWEEAVALGKKFGYRNAQVSLIAPTGTIALMMDSDTTGVEPDLALVKYKRLVGGGNFKIVNQGVEAALLALGYSNSEASAIVVYVHEHDTIEGAPELKAVHLSIFDCAFKPLKGERSIAPMGHVRMLAAVQPFVSGSVSKTVNMPSSATREDIKDIYMQSWKLGLKCVALYRDGCKRSQPLSTTKEGGEKVKLVEVVEKIVERPRRKRLPDTRKALTHKFDLQGHEGYLTVGLYEDGAPGEVFIVMAKEGSTISGLMDGFATQTSLALQYGVPLGVMAKKFTHMRFEPSGYTKNSEIPIAKSILDYLFRWLVSQFGTLAEKEEAGLVLREEDEAVVEEVAEGEIEEPVAYPVALSEARVKEHYETGAKTVEGATKLSFRNDTDAPSCANCGAIMVRGGTCYRCLNCGETAGCS